MVRYVVLATLFTSFGVNDVVEQIEAGVREVGEAMYVRLLAPNIILAEISVINDERVPSTDDVGVDADVLIT